MATASLAEHINSNNYDAATITRACVDMVHHEAGPLGVSGMYAALMQNARETGAVDQMLYQLAGDPFYAEQAALIVLSAAWNNEEAVEPIKRLLAAAAAVSEPVGDNELATSVLFGMYRIARHGAGVSEVTFRGPTGVVESRTLESNMAASLLFDSVRDLY